MIVALPLSWLEWKRTLRFRTLRMVALLFFVVALAGIFLRPQYQTSSSSIIALLTVNYDKQVVDSLLARYPTISIWHTPDAKPYKNSTEATSMHELLTHKHLLKFVIGSGLSVDALDLIKHHSFEFIPTGELKGITKISIPDHIVANRPTKISGQVSATSKEDWIFLEGPGGQEDSVQVTNSTSQSFELTFYPKLVGNFLYTITYTTREGKTHIEKIPIVVAEPEQLTILICQQYPTFETQRLKNFLAHQQHKIIIRYQLSKNIYRYEYANHPSTPVSTLTPTQLAAIDLLILDNETLQSLPSTEKNNILEAVNQGLGMLTLFNSIPDKRTTQFFNFSTTPIKSDTVTISGATKKYTLSTLPIRVQNIFGVEGITSDKQGVIAGFKPRGAGNIGFQFLQETYQLMLQGDSLTYSKQWIPLLEGIARAPYAPARIVFDHSFPYYTDEPLSFQYITSLATSKLQHDSVDVPLREDFFIDQVWHGKIWLDEPGWHSFQLSENQKPFYYYVSNAGDWKSVDAANQQYATQRASLRKQSVTTETTRVAKPVNPIIFYLLLLVSAGFLWLVPKL